MRYRNKSNKRSYDYRFLNNRFAPINQVLCILYVERRLLLYVCLIAIGVSFFLGFIVKAVTLSGINYTESLKNSASS